MAKIAKSTDSSSLAEVVDRILDKGIVIDAWAKVSLVGNHSVTRGWGYSHRGSAFWIPLKIVFEVPF